jgi:glycosyltransferase involved in cell wall biosynthesis
MIPHTIVPERFIYREKKQDFVLFLGRLTHGKGLHIAIEACRLALGNAGQRSVTTGRNVRTEAACENGLVGPPGRAGGAFADTPTARSVPANLCGLADLRLVVAGTHHGPESDELLDLGRQALGSAFEYVGFADYWKRRELLADAKALMYPTPALEPFGYTVLEANVSGTPALVSNWGAFTETVQNGVNGFRCRDAAGLAAALGELDRLTHAACRSSAVSRFGLTTCGTAMCRLLLSRGGAT